MSQNLLKDLNLQQQKAVIYDNGPLLILAGAGSGKTRVLTYKVAYLILEKNIDPTNILLVTFTNKAAEAMKERIKKILTSYKLPACAEASAGRQVTSPFAGTFHSFCARVLRIEGKHLGIPSNYLIYDESDQLDLIKEAMKKLDISSSYYKPHSILTTISSAKNELIKPLEYLQYARGHFQQTTARVYDLYQNLLKKYEALDFDDLIFKTVELFKKNPQVLAKYQARFPYLMVDEYHDTNHAQYELTRLLAKKSRYLTVVADCSQSIYGWRGADFKNVLHLKNDFPEIKIINLEQNYRSSQIILEAAFNVIKQNTSHPILRLWTNNHTGEKIKLYEARSEKDEANFIIEQIHLSIIHHPLLIYSDFAILYRTNAQSRVLEEAFLTAGIPYILVGGTKFYERKEVKDCLAYLRLLANAKDMVSYKRMEKLGKNRLEKFLALAEKINITKLTTAELLDKILKATAYWDLFDEKDEEDLARIENIKELFSVATEFPQLTEFLENVALVEQEFLPNSPIKNKAKKNAVTLMTMHSAKGLEFKTVFMVGLEEGLFPHSRSLLEKNELEEERRLAYVGITRAKENLYLIHAKRRLYFGVHNFNQISRFIIEIPVDLLELITYDYS